MKRNRKYNKNLVQENLMNGLRHIVLLLGIGLLFAQDPPEEFQYEISTLSAFYYFDSVTINGVEMNQTIGWVRLMAISVWVPRSGILLFVVTVHVMYQLWVMMEGKEPVVIFR